MGSVASHFASTTFCWLPPLSRITGLEAELGDDPEAFDRIGDGPLLERAHRPAQPPVRAVCAITRFSRTLMPRTSALAFAITGDVAQPRAHRVDGRSQARDHTVDLHGPCSLGPQPEQRVEQITSTGAHQPGQSHDLPAPDVEVGALDASGDREIADAQDWVLHLVARCLQLELLQLASDHLVDEPITVVLADRPAPDHASVAQHGDPIDDAEHLVHPVRYEHDRHALVAQCPYDRERRLDLLVAQGARRLVEDEHSGVHRDGTADLHHLLLVGPQGADRHRRIEIEPQTVQHLRSSPLRPPPVDPVPSAHLTVADQDVLGDRQIRNEGRLLRHGGDPRGQRLGRMGGSHLAASQHDAAGVGSELAGDDPQQRRLATAVRAAQPVDLAGEQRHVHAPQGVDSSVALLEALAGEDRLDLTPPAVPGDAIRGLRCSRHACR